MFLAKQADRPADVSAAKRADAESATEEDANAHLIGFDDRSQDNTKPVITDWKELGFTQKYERHDGGTHAQKGPMTAEQKAEQNPDRQ